MRRGPEARRTQGKGKKRELFPELLLFLCFINYNKKKKKEKTCGALAPHGTNMHPPLVPVSNMCPTPTHIITPNYVIFGNY